MKKYASIILLVICSLGVLSANSQTLEKLYHSKKVDSIVAVVDSVLRSNATWVNGLPIVKAKYCLNDFQRSGVSFVEKDICLDSTVYIPIYCDISFHQYRPVDTLTKDYFLSWRFVQDLDSNPQPRNKVFEQSTILLYDYHHREVYITRGHFYKKITKCSVECCNYFEGDYALYKFVAELCYGGRADFVFLYPTIWDGQYCYSPGYMLFAVKDEHLYVILNCETISPCIVTIEDFVDCCWDRYVKQW